MQVIEVISYYINHGSNTLDIKFRLNEDSESDIRIDEIDLNEIDDFGYNIILEEYDFYDETEEDEDPSMNQDIDEEELLIFLNEYYTIYPDRVPIKDLY